MRHKTTDAAIPFAIVIGIGSYNDLGIIRSFGEAGIKSIYLIHVPQIIIPIYKSRYVEAYKYIHLEDLLNELTLIEKNNPRSKFILVGASDAAVLQIEEISKSLNDSYIYSRINGSFIYNMRKDIMGMQARESGLTVPWTLNVLFKDNIPDIPNDIYPLIIKPSNSVEGNKSDISICENREELLFTIKKLKAKGYKETLIQQYIHNSESKEVGITGVSCPNGDIIIHGIIDKIRNRCNINNFGQYYPNTDVSVIDSLKQYIKKIGYVGIFDTDFIVYNNIYYFIECNFRNGAYGYCVTSGGFNMCAQWAESEGIHCKKNKRKKLRDIKFMEERTDVLNVFDGSMTLCAWLKDLFTTDVFLWWNCRDPRPMLRLPYFIKKHFK